MGATNKTLNYELPIFIGTDKPSWLGDFNFAMNKIDSSIKENKDEIDSLKTRMTTTETVANSASSSASTALTKANTAQTTADVAQSTADTANTKAEGAQSTANTALSNASNAQNTADNANSTAQTALSSANVARDELNKFNITNIETFNSSQITTDYGSLSTNSKITVATNSDGSIAKIYGDISLSNTQAPTGQTRTIKVTIPNTKLRPKNIITISGCSIRSIYTPSGLNSISPLSYTISTSGTITFTLFSNDITSSFNVFLFACLLFIKDFGDVTVE